MKKKKKCGGEKKKLILYYTSVFQIDFIQVHMATDERLGLCLPLTFLCKKTKSIILCSPFTGNLDPTS